MFGYLLIFILCLTVFVGLLTRHFLTVTQYRLCYKKLPKEFDGFKIVQISDLHERFYGEKNEKIINKIASLDPDMIVITGDMADEHGTAGGSYVSLFEGISKIAPVFCVMGNHEYKGKRSQEELIICNENGIISLEDRGYDFVKDGASISITGLSDEEKFNIVFDTPVERLSYIMDENKSAESFNLLLTHRNDYADEFSKMGVDLMLCGHMHGGQIRLPIIGAVFSPSGGRLFPVRTKGLYRVGDMDLVVSGGLGESTIPVRFFNCPEIVEIELYAEDEA